MVTSRAARASIAVTTTATNHANQVNQPVTAVSAGHRRIDRTPAYRPVTGLSTSHRRIHQPPAHRPDTGASAGELQPVTTLACPRKGRDGDTRSRRLSRDCHHPYHKTIGCCASDIMVYDLTLPLHPSARYLFQTPRACSRRAPCPCGRSAPIPAPPRPSASPSTDEATVPCSRRWVLPAHGAPRPERGTGYPKSTRLASSVGRNSVLRSVPRPPAPRIHLPLPSYNRRRGAAPRSSAPSSVGAAYRGIARKETSPLTPRASSIPPMQSQSGGPRRPPDPRRWGRAPRPPSPARPDASCSVGCPHTRFSTNGAGRAGGEE